MALQTYTDAAVYINGALLVEHASVKVSRKTNAQNVNTVHKGFAGQSPGAPIASVSIENAVPSSGFEFDPGSRMKVLEPFDLVVYAASKTFATRGYCDEDDFSHAVNTEAKQSMQCTTQFAEWE